MTIEIVELASKSELNATTNSFQSPFWAEVKSFVSWDSYFFLINNSPLLVLTKKLIFNIYLAYIPYGPPILIKDHSINSYIETIAKELKKHLPKNTIFLRIDLPWGSLEKELSQTKNLKFNFYSIQAEATIIISLERGYQQVRNSFKKRTIRHIQKCEKANLLVKEWDQRATSFDKWYSIYLETAQKEQFSKRSGPYIKHILSIKDQNNQAKLFLAYLDDEIVGGIVVIFNDKEASYLFGATLKSLEVSPSYMLHNYALKYFCDKKLSSYNLMGVTGPNNKFPFLKSVTFFKEGFGGKFSYRHPTVDYIYNRFLHFSFIKLEKLRALFH